MSKGDDPFDRKHGPGHPTGRGRPLLPRGSALAAAMVDRGNGSSWFGSDGYSVEIAQGRRGQDGTI